MCCLRYEHESYEYEIKRTPPIDSTVKTPDGIGTVTEMSPLQGTIKVRLADKPDTQPKTYHRKDVTVISK
jgi:cell fate regulator YaaT (PSP1 superfamily)